MGRGIPTTAPKEVIEIKKSIAFYLALTNSEQEEVKNGKLKKENLKEYKKLYKVVETKLKQDNLNNKDMKELEKALSNYTKINILKSSLDRKSFLMNFFSERGFKRFIKIYS